MRPDFQSFPKLLQAWYVSHPREMPWRGIPDPYAVWVSEIMLQQTQVETVRGYFRRFLNAFPTVQALAAAPQEAVLKQWEGLGYYTRARNLQAAAQAVVAAGGVLPRTAADWSRLPGVGPYTAAAIASISFGEAVPVVDGNVSRVLSRLLLRSDDFHKMPAREKLAVWLAPHIARATRPGDFNQALMDVGETVCRPLSPDCGACPLTSLCRARATSRQTEFPVKAVKKTLPVRRFTAFLIIAADGRVWLAKRTGERLLNGLWELPNVEAALPATRLRAAFRKLTGADARAFTRLATVEHTFSHFHQTVSVFRVLLRAGRSPAETPTFHLSIPSSLPLTTVARKILAAAKPRLGAR